jgi:hypothetical protein
MFAVGGAEPIQAQSKHQRLQGRASWLAAVAKEASEENHHTRVDVTTDALGSVVLATGPRLVHKDSGRPPKGRWQRFCQG